MFSIYRQSSSVIFLFIVSLFTLSACGGGGSGGEGNKDEVNEGGAPPQTDEQPGANQAVLGPLSGADIRAYRLTDLTNPIEGPVTANSSVTDLQAAGSFDLDLGGIPDAEWILVSATGGQDIDADDDGIIDAAPTRNRGTVHALGRASDWREGENTVNALSEIAWRTVRSGIESGEIDTVAEKLQWIAVNLLRDDLDGDQTVGYRDLLAFQPSDQEHRELTQLSPDELRPIIDGLLAGSESEVNELLTQQLGQSLQLPAVPTYTEVDVQVEVPGNRNNVLASDVSVRTLLSEKPEVDLESGATLLMAEDSQGRTVLLGYAMPQAGTSAQAVGAQNAGRTAALAGTTTTGPTVSTESTAFALVMSMAGGGLDDDLRAELMANVLEHSEYQELVDRVTETFEADPYFLDSLALYTDLVAQIQRVASESLQELLDAYNPEKEQSVSATQAFQTMRSYNTKSNSFAVQSEGLNKEFCRFVPRLLCASAWKSGEPWNWYGTANGINVRGKPFLAVQSANRQRVATANPGMVNFSMHLYDESGQFLGWRLVPRNSTLLQKNIQSGAAQRTMNVGSRFPQDTQHVEFHKYRFNFTGTQKGEAQISGLNTIHMIASLISLASTSANQFIVQATDTLQKVQTSLDVMTCFQGVLTGVDYYADDDADGATGQFAAFFRNNFASLSEALFNPSGGCAITLWKMALKEAAAKKLALLGTTASTELAVRFSNPAGWAVVIASATNDLAPFVGSYFTGKNSPALYQVNWFNNGVDSITSLDGRPDPDSGTTRQLPVADMMFTPGDGLTLHFDANGSSVDDRTGVTYAWDFGENTTAASDSIAHTFPEPGSYTVSLVVTDDWGQSDTVRQTIAVTDGQPPAVVDISCFARPNESTVFVATEVTDPDNDLVELRWYLNSSETQPARITVPSGNKVDTVDLDYLSDSITSFSPMLVAVDAGGNEAQEICYVRKGEIGDDNAESGSPSDILFDGSTEFTPTASENVSGSCSLGQDENGYFASVWDQNAEWWCANVSPTFAPVTSNSNFTIEFDFNPIQPDWGQYPSIVFFDRTEGALREQYISAVESRQSLYFGITWSDSVYKKFRIRDGVNNYHSESIPAANERYRVKVDYNSDNKTIDWLILREDGSVFLDRQGLAWIFNGSFDNLMVGEVGGGPSYGDNAQIRVGSIRISTNSSDDDSGHQGPVAGDKARFKATTDRVAFRSDYLAECQAEFGADWAVAEWANIKSLYENGDPLADLVGILQGGSHWVTRNSEHFHTSSRDYLVAHFGGNKPGSWAAFDNIGNHTFSLGSWYGEKKVLCSPSSNAAGASP